MIGGRWDGVFFLDFEGKKGLDLWEKKVFRWSGRRRGGGCCTYHIFHDHGARPHSRQSLFAWREFYQMCSPSSLTPRSTCVYDASWWYIGKHRGTTRTW